MDGRMVRYMIALCVAFVAVACSTTSRLGEGEVLYTGVKKLRVNVPDTVEVPGGVSDNIKSTINVKPNNSLYSPYVRHPFPLGLWLYNHWSEDEKGIKGWIYRKFVEQPVLISDVRPDLRVKMMEDMLAKNGFFGATSTYELLYDKRNPKKARVNYTVNLPVPKRISEVILLDDTTELSGQINKIARRDSYLRVGEIFCNDSLADVRNKVAGKLVCKTLHMRFVSGCNVSILRFKFGHGSGTCSACRLIGRNINATYVRDILYGLECNNHLYGRTVRIGNNTARNIERILRIDFRHHQRHIVIHTESTRIVYHERTVLRNGLFELPRSTAASRYESHVHSAEIIVMLKPANLYATSAEIVCPALAALRPEQQQFVNREFPVSQHSQELLTDSPARTYNSYFHMSVFLRYCPHLNVSRRIHPRPKRYHYPHCPDSHTQLLPPDDRICLRALHPATDWHKPSS